MKVLVLVCMFISIVAKAQVIGGSDVPTNHYAFKSTVALVLKKGENFIPFCSGSLIAPNVVLTAAHCLVSLSEGEIYISIGKDARTGTKVKASFFKYYSKGYYPDVGGGLEDRDVGFIVLDSTLEGSNTIEIGSPNSIMPADSVVQAGYGMSCDDETDQNCSYDNLGILYMLTSSRVEEQKQHYVLVNEFKEKRSAGGDSGGPLMMEREGKPTLHGITSQGVTSYTDDENESLSYQTLYTHPYYFVDWINCSLPAGYKIESSTVLADQVPCDEQPMLTLTELFKFNKNLCEQSREGFSIVKFECWPVTKLACESFAKEMDIALLWDDETSECF